MYLLLSGEGPSDMGSNDAGVFLPGPMALMADQWIKRSLNYSLLDSDSVAFIAKREISSTSKQIKSLSQRGKKTPQETRYFYKNARALAQLAKEKSAEIGDNDMVAISFHDSDGTASSDRGEWQDKYDSILKGFSVENFANGVAMLPKPQSEAWALCALEKNYRHCVALENASRHSMKDRLEAAIGESGSREVLNRKIEDGEFDIAQIDMPSINAFKDRLDEVLKEL